MNDGPPRDPVVYALWVAWRWLRDRPTPTPTRLDIRLMPDAPNYHVAMFVGDYVALQANASADPKPGTTDRIQVPCPEPVEWVSSDPLVVDFNGHSSAVVATLYAKAPGEAIVTVTTDSPPLEARASVKVSHPTPTRLDILPWEDPPNDPPTNPA